MECYIGPTDVICSETVESTTLLRVHMPCISLDSMEAQHLFLLCVCGGMGGGVDMSATNMSGIAHQGQANGTRPQTNPATHC